MHLTLPMDYVDTYYRRTLADPGEPFEPLATTHQADVCVIGGGMAGINTALELARLGRQVCVLEANRISWGASGRNGGFVSPGYSTGQEHIRRKVGQARADALFRLSLEGMQRILDNINELRIPGIQLRYGALKTLRYDTASSRDALEQRRDLMQHKFDYPLRLVDRNELREKLRSTKYFAGLHDNNAFQFHPLNYSLALVQHIRALGGSVFEQSPAVGVIRRDEGHSVVTPAGNVLAKDVVYATGGYTGVLEPRLKRSYLPIATYVLLSEKHPELLASAIRTRDGVGDSRRAGDYYRLVEGGEQLLWGGRITTRTSEPRALACLLRNTMVSTYPQLAELKVDVAWSGLMSYARHLMPQIHKLGDGRWCCTAFGGHGMNTATIGGRLVAEAIVGESERYRLFEPYGLVWNGGLLGTGGVQLTYWSYQLLDYLKERGSASRP